MSSNKCTYLINTFGDNKIGLVKVRSALPKTEADEYKSFLREVLNFGKKIFVYLEIINLGHVKAVSEHK